MYETSWYIASAGPNGNSRDLYDPCTKEQATVFAEHLARIADDTVLIKDITTKFKKAHFLGKSNAFIKIEAEKQLPDGNTLKNTYGDLEVRKTPFSLQEILDRVVPFLRRSNYM